MPKTYTVTEYDKDDIESLDNMTTDEVIDTLELIKRGWLPRDIVYVPIDGRTYTQSEYDSTKLQVAMRKAIEILEQQKEKESETGYDS